MARKELIVDDLDGSDGASTVTFSFEDHKWEIDLAPANVEKLAKVLQPFVNKAREVAKKSSSNGNGESVAARLWAQQTGIDIAPKGKIPTDILEKYRAWKLEEGKRRAAEMTAGKSADKPATTAPAEPVKQ
ncbi:histone-like nucleoid-structuring protein Lsr2 [Pedococcus soli]